MARRLAVVAVGVLVLKAFVSAFESRLVFFPYKGEDDNPATLGLPYEQIRLSTSDGETLVAWQFEPQAPVADVVYFHGNGGNLSVWLPALAALHRQNLRVLAVDYRGYGLSTGAPSEQGLYRDAEAAIRHASEHRGASGPLVYWGRSLGGAVAAHATRVVPADGLILESAFPDKASIIRRQPVLRLLNVFAAYRFPVADLLDGSRTPVLVMHGDRDTIIPFALGRELFDRLAPPKQFVRVSGADHNDFFGPDRADYWRPILDFIGILKGNSR